MLKQLGMKAMLVVVGAGLFVGVNAQTATVGNLSGTVRDPSGAAVPKAEVEIKEEGTGATRTANANDDGYYVFSSLPAGKYTVSTAPQGFKRTVASGVEVHVAENRVLNLDLQVGQVSETVNITSDSAPVETRSGDVSSLISEKQITELPLNGRNYSQLALMVPGVSPVTQAGAGGAFAARGTGLDGGVDMSVNGNGSNQNLWTVDGVNNMDVGSNRTLLVFPSIDSIAEFRVMRNSFSAEYGQAQGAVVNLITKGGSNQFHGGLFGFLRDDKLNASPFFLNNKGSNPDGTPRAPKGELKYKNFGGNFSGPIVKNKLFFFWSEEWRFEDRGVTVQGNVPSAAEKVGDFSAPRALLTGTLPHRAGLVCDPNNDANYGPNPVDPGCYPGNRIPTAQLSPAGLALLKIYPDPIRAGGGLNWASSPLQPIRTRQDSIRGDWTVTSNMNVMVRYINEKWTHGQDTQQWGDVPFPTLADDWAQPSRSFSVKLTNTLSSTAVNDFQFSRAGNDIFITTSPQSTALVDEISSKFPTVFPHAANVPSVMWGPGGYNDIWHQAPWQNHEDLFSWKDDFSKVVGSHELKFGALYSHNIKNEQAGGAAGGNTPAFITGCNAKTGNCMADLLDRTLTLTNYAEIGETRTALGRWRDTEFYANDTWKARPNVTLTLGLRYSQFPAAHVDNDEMSNFVPEFYDGVSYTSALITPATAEARGLPRSLVKLYKKGFQPRVGIAWDVFGDGKTAVRAGFGRYMSRSNVIEDVNRMVNNPPWTTQVDSGWSGATDTLATCPTCRTMDAIGPGLRNQVVGVSQTGQFAAVDINFRPPQSYQWNLTVSREIFKNTVLEASYIGNRGLHIWRRNVNWNDVPAGVACKGAQCDPTLPNDARFQIAAQQRRGINTDALAAANRRINTLGPIQMAQSTGNSNYNGLQLWLNRRFADRLSYQVSYTWSHTISDIPITSFTNSTTDPFNYALDKGDADLDRRHSLVGNMVYQLPTLKSWGPVANHILGDWQINAIYSYFGATPVDVLSGVNTYGTAGNVNPRPNLVAGVPVYLNTPDKEQWLNPAAFSLPGVGQIGSLGKGAIRGKPINNIDFSVAKNWRFRERYGLQFRAEMFNAINHTNFVGFNNNLQFDGVQFLAGGAPNPNFGRPTNGSFGRLTAAQNPREIQFGLKFSF
ncbi:MAG TPA: carboxypeptidase regulatory-like domain-containing protein [Pyrinomonadaceae bacterium]|nr:carboxypeptidase regulatory-like domain-containing protein [Pyrinomonadaceae bacterium]